MITFAIAMALLGYCTVTCADSTVEAMHFPVLKCSEHRACNYAKDNCTSYTYDKHEYHCCGDDVSGMCMLFDMFIEKIAWLTSAHNLLDSGQPAELYKLLVDLPHKERINYVIRATSYTTVNYHAEHLDDHTVKKIVEDKFHHWTDEDSGNKAHPIDDTKRLPYHDHRPLPVNERDRERPLVESEIPETEDREQLLTTHHTKPSATPTVDIVIATLFAVVLLVVVGAYITYSCSRSRSLSRANENNNTTHDHSQCAPNSETSDELQCSQNIDNNA